MEYTLRCNSLKCRKELNERAIVTTCSHVFCFDCANRLQMANLPASHQPVCPACDTRLPHPDDVAVAVLNPSEDYKTSILSGLSPSIIMECASRALSFWAYQTTQEVVYQEYLSKTLTDKYTTLNTQVDKIIHDANAEISGVRAKMANMSVDQDNLRRKNEDVVQALREKTRKHLQTQELYDKLKRRAMLGQVQTAASDAVDYNIHASVTGNRYVDRAGDGDQHLQQHPLISGIQNSLMQPPPQNLIIGATASGPNPTSRISGWNGFGSQGSNNQNNTLETTPSSHRQRVNPGQNVGLGISSLHNSLPLGTPLPPQHTMPARRSPLTNLNINSINASGFAGYGLSAGVKEGRADTANGFVRPVLRSRVANRRPSSSYAAPQQPSFGSSSGINMFNTGNAYY